MGDVVYPGVELNRVDPQISAEKVLEYLSNQFKSVSNLYRNEEPEIVVIDKKHKPAIVIVRGLMLTLNQIRERIGRSLMSGRQVFVTNVDFYIPRNITGDFDHMNLVLHNNLREGQGILPPLNLFSDQFNKEFGILDHQNNVAFYRGKKGSIPIGELKSCGNVLSFGSTTHRGIWKHTKEYYASTEVTYTYRSEAVQAVCFLNLKTFNGVPRVFVTSDDGIDCLLTHNCGLGREGKLLKIAGTIRRMGYLPFEDFNMDLLSSVKLKRLTTICHFCDQQFELLGWGPELSWIAATCKCESQKLGLRWKGENFIRLVTSRHGRKMLTAPEGTENGEKIGLYPFIKGIVPLFDDVHHFRASAWVAYRMECAYSARRLRSQQALGMVMEAVWVEDGEVRDTKVSYFHVCFSVKVRGPSTAWTDGSVAISRVTIIRQHELEIVSQSSFITMRQEKESKRISSVVHDIVPVKDAPKTFKLTVVAILLRGEKIGVGEQCTLIPKGPVGEQHAIMSALSSWSKELEFRQNPPSVIPCTILVSRSVWTPYMQKHLLGRIGMNIDISVKRNMLWDMLKPQMDKIYLGCKLHVSILDAERKIRTTSICCRVKEIHSPKVGENTELRLFTLVPDTTRRVLSEESSLTLWLISQTPDLQKCKNATTTAIHDEMCDSDVESDFSNAEIPIERNNEAPRITFNHKVDPTLEPSSSTKLDELVKHWIVDPFEPCTIMDFLLHPSNIVHHDLHLESAVPKLYIDRSKLHTMLSRLDASQYKAVKSMMSSRLSVCQGPAGTGKTTMVACGVASICMQEQGMIVVCAPTNFAASVVYEKIKQVNESHDLQMLVIRMFSQSNENKHLREARNSDEQDPNFLHIMARLDPAWLACPKVNLVMERERQVGTSKLTNKENELLRSHRLRIHVDALSKADVVVCTVGCASDGRISSALRTLQRRGIPLSALIVDESSIMTIPTTLPLLRLNPVRVFLAGDHCQLCPLLGDETAKLANLDVSWFAILRQTRIGKNESVVSLLTTQYRMAVPIANVVSGYIYGNLVKSAESVKQRSYKRYDNMLLLFPEMREAHISIQTYDPLGELQDKNSTSFYNDKEIMITKKILLKLHAANVLDNVCILSMYESHVNHLQFMKDGLGKEFQGCFLATTDSYQGRECDILIINMVRSNATKQIGFLRDQRRVNVAISRARDYVFLVGHLPTIQCGKIPSVKILLDMLLRENVQVVKWETGEEGTNGVPSYLERVSK